MKFTRDLCRLLGLGGDGPGEEELEAQDGASDPADGRKGQSSEVTVKNEEGLDEKERAKRRAERRRAKRKRQKERKKLEREERMEDALEQEEASGGAVTESNSEEEYKEEESWTAVRPSNKCNPETVPGLMTTENKNNCKLPHRTSEEMEPEWDVSSAFVANAASHIKLKGLKSRGLQITRENKENEARSSQGENTEEMKRRGESLTEQGIQMFGRGQYSQAVHMFSEAIYCDPKDHRFYGNRSYCYLCLEQYSSALKDAQRSIELAPDWPKGFFRKGCALMGLKRYNEAEKAMEQVLKLDQHIKEASSKLVTCRILQLMDMGFEEEQSKLLLQKFNTVQGILNSPEAKALKQTSLQDQSGSCRSLWVGNITLEVTEKDLWDLFKIFGEIESIRVLHERFCAFVNFKNTNMAARALEKLQTLYNVHVSSWPGGGAREHQAGDEVPGPLDPADSALHTKDQHQLQCCRNTELSFHRVQTDGACKWTRVLLLADNRLFLWRQATLQTHTRPARAKQETLATLTISPSFPCTETHYRMIYIQEGEQEHKIERENGLPGDTDG